MSDRTAPIRDAWRRLPPRVRSVGVPVAVVVLIALYPNYYQSLFSAVGGGTTGQLIPTVPTMVVMCVYVIMALGLNVVVGYAGYWCAFGRVWTFASRGAKRHGFSFFDPKREPTPRASR